MESPPLASEWHENNTDSTTCRRRHHSRHSLAQSQPSSRLIPCVYIQRIYIITCKNVVERDRLLHLHTKCIAILSFVGVILQAIATDVNIMAGTQLTCELLTASRLQYNYAI